MSDIVNKIDKDELQRIKELQEIVDEACLFDDEYMNLCFEGENECTKELLLPIIQKDDLVIVKVETQKELRGINGKFIRLDILAQDSKGKKYNIEVQKQNKGANIKRARLNISMLDSTYLKAGQTYNDLPETYVIFITENDIFRRGLGLYKIEHKFDDNNETVDIGTHIIYVNGAYRKEDRLGRLISDLWEREPNKMNNRMLARRCNFIKGKDIGKSEEGGYNMASPLLKKYQKIWEEEGIQKGMSQGKQENAFSTARAMLQNNLGCEMTARCTGLSVEQVRSLL